MNIRLKKALTVVGATAALALVVSACSSASGKVTASSIDCSQSVKDRIAVVNAVAAVVNADQKALTKATGGPGETPAKNKLKADTQIRDSLDKQNKACASPSKSPSPSASPAACASSWVMTTSTPKNGKWVAEGVTSIQTAQTSDQAKAAAEDWLDKIKTVPGTLAGAAAYVLNKQVDSSTLVKNGCATPAAESLTQELQVAIALSTVTPSNAPSNAVNSLTSNGQVFAETVAGITGNTKAVKIVTKTTTTYVMARCGNAVRPGVPPVPLKPLPTPSCKQFPNPYGPGFVFSFTVCNWVKPPQSKNCMLNGSWTQGCPPNQADQPVQSNPGQPVGKTSGAPTQAPPYNPPTPNPTTGPAPTPEPTGPGYNSGGGTGSAPGGTSCTGGVCTTGSASPTTSPSPDPGNSGVTHSPAPSDSGMPSMPS